MTAADNMAELDEALERLRGIVKRRGWSHATVFVHATGDVNIYFADDKSTRKTLFASLVGGREEPLPSAAIERLEEES